MMQVLIVIYRRTSIGFIFLLNNSNFINFLLCHYINKHNGPHNILVSLAVLYGVAYIYTRALCIVSEIKFKQFSKLLRSPVHLIRLRVSVSHVLKAYYGFSLKGLGRVYVNGGGRSSYGVNFGDIDRCIRVRADGRVVDVLWAPGESFHGDALGKTSIPYPPPLPTETDGPRLTRDPPTVH